jgi:hypothetical protein
VSILISLVAPMTPHLAESAGRLLAERACSPRRPGRSTQNPGAENEVTACTDQRQEARRIDNFSRRRSECNRAPPFWRWMPVKTCIERSGAEKDHRGSAKDCEHCRLISLQATRRFWLSACSQPRFFSPVARSNRFTRRLRRFGKALASVGFPRPTTRVEQEVRNR